MDLNSLAPAVHKYFQNGLAPSTHKSYQAALKKFYLFCSTYNVYTPFPLTEHILCTFVAFMADQGLAPQTVKSYIAAVRSMQISLGLLDPRDQSSFQMLRRVQAGITRLRMLQGTTHRVRLPVTPHIMFKVRESLSLSSNPDRRVIWAVITTAFFGFFRLGELLPESATGFNIATDLAWGDVAVDNRQAPKMVQIHLKKSKTHQFGRGVDVVVGTTGSPLCPVAAVVDYISERGSQPGPFFLNPDKTALTKSQFVSRFRSTLQLLGFPQDDYAGHSFRIGAATTAASSLDSMIQTLGRWHSAAFLQYIRTPKEQLAALSATLASSAVQPNS